MSNIKRNKIKNVTVFPKVFETGKTHDIFISFKGEKLCAGDISVKIQPMENYGILHTSNYRIDEEERHPYLPVEEVKIGVYKVNYAFFDEQKYDVKVKVGQEVVYNGRIYSVFEDFVGINVFKGDTHLHSNRSDGEGTPFEVGCAYRAKGYDFIVVTDHHRYAPSIEAKQEFEPLTNEFAVFKGEEVHNKDMGYFHIINFDGDFSVNDIVENKKEYVDKEIEKILKTTKIDDSIADKRDCAYRIFIANEIRKGNGLAIMAHPFWDCFGEYNIPTITVEYLIKNGYYDCLELLAGNDIVGQNGNNLLIELYNKLQREGAKITVLGASDAHSTTNPTSVFNKQYSFVFANSLSGIKNAMKEGKTVAVLVIDKNNYFVFGEFRLVKYARFLFDEYYPNYIKLTDKHAKALAEKDGKKIERFEKEIKSYKEEFFAW